MFVTSHTQQAIVQASVGLTWTCPNKLSKLIYLTEYLHLEICYNSVYINSLLVIVWVVYSSLPCLYVNVSLACTNGDIRLVGAVSNLEGRVEICDNATWGTVCDNGWETVDANVACGQLGFRRSGQYLTIWLVWYKCRLQADKTCLRQEI